MRPMSEQLCTYICSILLIICIGMQSSDLNTKKMFSSIKTIILGLIRQFGTNLVPNKVEFITELFIKHKQTVGEIRGR